MSRERFEKLFPVPEWASFSGPTIGYCNPAWRDLDPATNLERLETLSWVNALWRGCQSRQPEIDELVNMLNQAFGRDDPLIGWRGAASRADLFRCEFCGVEHLDDSQLEHAPHCLVTKGRALIAKHKGGA